MKYEIIEHETETRILGDGVLVAAFYGDGMYNNGKLAAEQYVRMCEADNEKWRNQIFDKVKQLQ